MIAPQSQTAQTDSGAAALILLENPIIILDITFMSTQEFTNVTAKTVGNVYFDGQVISHSIITADGERKALGVILPGQYYFATEAAERMEIVSGECTYALKDSSETHLVKIGEAFKVQENTGFTITVVGEPCHYICSYL